MREHKKMYIGITGRKVNIPTICRNFLPVVSKQKLFMIQFSIIVRHQLVGANKCPWVLKLQKRISTMIGILTQGKNQKLFKIYF